MFVFVVRQSDVQFCFLPFLLLFCFVVVVFVVVFLFFFMSVEGSLI